MFLLLRSDSSWKLEVGIKPRRQTKREGRRPESDGGGGSLTHGQLRQSAAQLLRDVVQLLQLGLLLPSVLAHDFLLQPLVGLAAEIERERGGGGVSEEVMDESESAG